MPAAVQQIHLLGFVSGTGLARWCQGAI